MAARRKKAAKAAAKGGGAKKRAKTPRPAPESAARRGLPNPSTVVEVRTIEVPGGKTMRILRTTQHDPYDDE